jgi:hypothetical protein
MVYHYRFYGPEWHFIFPTIHITVFFTVSAEKAQGNDTFGSFQVWEVLFLYRKDSSVGLCLYLTEPYFTSRSLWTWDQEKS